MITTSEIVVAILTGECDSTMNHILQALSERRKTIAAQTYASVDVGTRVQFGGHVKPHYLQGKRGVITAMRQSKVVVKLDVPAGRFQNGVVCNPSSFNIIEQVNAQ